ncbi:unnamed protein product [Leuciscus chuanchicus]
MLLRSSDAVTRKLMRRGRDQWEFKRLIFCPEESLHLTLQPGRISPPLLLLLLVRSECAGDKSSEYWGQGLPARLALALTHWLPSYSTFLQPSADSTTLLLLRDQTRSQPAQAHMRLKLITTLQKRDEIFNQTQENNKKRKYNRHKEKERERLCYVRSRQSHQDTWLSLHTDTVCLKKMKIFGRVFIRSEADTFATLAFQANLHQPGLQVHIAFSGISSKEITLTDASCFVLADPPQLPQLFS